MYNDLVFNEVNITEIIGFNVSSVAMDSTPEILISKGKLVRADGVKIFNKEYGKRRINVTGYITASDRAGYYNVRSLLLRYLEPIEKQLRVFDGQKHREFTATVENTIISDAGGGFANVDIEFTCSDPYGYDVNNTVLLDASNYTDADEDLTFVEAVGGNFHAPFEVTITVQGITGGSEQAYIKLTSQSGTYIRIDRTWADDDVITIDTKLKECKVNGLFTDYTGNFFDLQPDQTYINISTDLTTHDSYVTLQYKQRTL